MWTCTWHIRIEFRFLSWEAKRKPEIKYKMLCKWQVKYRYVNWLKCFYCPNDKNVSLSEFDFFFSILYFSKLYWKWGVVKNLLTQFPESCPEWMPTIWYLVFSNKHIKTCPQAHWCPCKQKMLLFFKIEILNFLYIVNLPSLSLWNVKIANSIRIKSVNYISAQKHSIEAMYYVTKVNDLGTGIRAKYFIYK